MSVAAGAADDDSDDPDDADGDESFAPYRVLLAPVLDVSVRETGPVAAQVAAEMAVIEALGLDADGVGGEQITAQRVQLIDVGVDRKQALDDARDDFAAMIAEQFGVPEDAVGWGDDLSPGDGGWGEPPDDTDLDL